MANKNEWTNHGDVNPMEHGGQWLLKDDESKNCYYVVTWEPLDGMEANGEMCDGYVDLTDTWFDLQEVADWADWNDYTSEEQRVCDLFRFYGPANFGGDTKLISHKEMTDYLYDREIWTPQD